MQEEKDSFQTVALELVCLLSSVTSTSTIGTYLHRKTKLRDEEFLEIGAGEGAFRAFRAPPGGKARNKTIRDNHSNPMVDNS